MTEEMLNAVADAFMKSARQAENKNDSISGFFLAQHKNDVELVAETLHKFYPELDITEFYSRSGCDRKSRVGAQEVRSDEVKSET